MSKAGSAREGENTVFHHLRYCVSASLGSMVSRLQGGVWRVARGGARGESDRGVCPGGGFQAGARGEKKGARLTSCKCESSSAASSAASGIIVFGGGGYAGLGWLPILGRGVARGCIFASPRAASASGSGGEPIALWPARGSTACGKAARSLADRQAD